MVENKPARATPPEPPQVAKSAPDGYTFLVTVNAPVTMNSHMQKNFPFDPMKSFTPVIKVADVVMTLAVNAKLPVNNVQELIDYAKKNPDQKMSFGSAGIGSAHHIAGELLKQKTGLNMVHVPYEAADRPSRIWSQAISRSASGPRPRCCRNPQAGTIRIIALAETKRSPDLPSVPTISETVPGVEPSPGSACSRRSAHRSRSSTASTRSFPTHQAARRYRQAQHARRNRGRRHAGRPAEIHAGRIRSLEQSHSFDRHQAGIRKDLICGVRQVPGAAFI